MKTKQKSKWYYKQEIIGNDHRINVFHIISIKQPFIYYEQPLFVDNVIPSTH